ncbi:DUF6099 family protein [Streptomyces sp. ODS28]|uniref:DUF6099 family protein n=1 Tax=Streptomyces sp. ODS28 TaxID=3136688 RepID=UPI0031E7BA95
MDAVCLIEATRHALAKSAEASAIVTEACQAHALAEAVGAHLAVSGPPVVRNEALRLSEAGGLAGAALRVQGSPGADGVRAAQLSMVVDPRGVLHELSTLLGETGAALFSAAVEAEDEGLYWQCVEAIDATDESGDRVTAILRRLDLLERGGVA